MVTLNTTRQSSLVLSRGAVLDTTWPAIRDNFPDGSTTSIDFLDSSGTVVATITGTVEPRRLVYLETDVDKLDSVPNGAQYELFVVTSNGPYKLEYGVVIRREASFFTPPPSALEGEARLYVDLLNRDAIGRRWITTAGGITMHNLGGDPVRYAMGPNVGLLFSQAGMRYFRPMGGDSWRIKFSIYSTGSVIGIGGTGRMRVHMGCDIRLNTGMSFEIETNVLEGNNRVHTGIVTGPTDIDYTGDPVVNPSADGDIWTVDYSNITKTLNAYKGPDPNVDPTIEWEDDMDLLPHGPGYRYWGFSWDSTLAATGSLLLSVEAQDYV